MSSSAERELRRIAQGEPPRVNLTHPVPKHPWLVLRAAGSLGAIDLILRRHHHALYVEVKSTGNVTEKGGATLDLTSSSGRGLDQRDLLANIHDHHQAPNMRVGFALQRKGHRPEGVPRWTWHPIESVRDETQIHAVTGSPLVVNLDEAPSMEVPA